jgi:hypothetical protein
MATKGQAQQIAPNERNLSLALCCCEVAPALAERGEGEIHAGHAPVPRRSQTRAELGVVAHTADQHARARSSVCQRANERSYLVPLRIPCKARIHARVSGVELVPERRQVHPRPAARGVAQECAESPGAPPLLASHW